jgi:hypothetical protein
MNNNNLYHDMLDQYIQSIKNIMYTFEITKCCNYSTFVTIYKDESLADLYSKVAYHIGGEINFLYFIDPQNQKIRVPLSNQPVFKFVAENVRCRPAKLVPIYPLPNPVVYRIYLNDGMSHEHCNDEI